MPPLKSKFSLVTFCVTLAYLNCIATLSLGTVETQGSHRNTGKPLRSVGRTSGSRSSASLASSRVVRPPEHRSGITQQTHAAPPQHSHGLHHHPNQPTYQHHPLRPPQTSVGPPGHPSVSTEPPPPAHPYSTGNAKQPSQPSLGQSPTAQGVGSAGSPLVPNAHLSGQAPGVSSGTGASSMAKTAVSSVVGSAIGSMVGTSLANSLINRSVASSEVSTATSTTTLPPTITAPVAEFSETSESNANTTTSAASAEPHTTKLTGTAEKPTSADTPRPPLDSPAVVQFVFRGVGEQELRRNLKSPHSFGTSVQEAVVRSLGVSPERVALKDVSFSLGSSEKDPPKARVTLSLLPDGRLLTTEPSALELANEINRQVKQRASYLSRQLLLVLPQLPEEFLEPGLVEAAVLPRADLDGKAANSGNHAFSVGLLFTLFSVCLYTWL